MRHTEKWYQRRLAKYFEDHYWTYEYTAEFYIDPAVDKYVFDIVEKGEKIHVILTCNEDGSVSEQRFTK